MKNKNIYIILIITVFALAAYFSFFNSSDVKKTELTNETKIDTLQKEEKSLEICSAEEVNLFFKDFIAAFNSQKPNKMDKFINPDEGFLSFYYDGVYPILDFQNSFKTNLEWYKDSIFESISSEKFPEYFGDGEFEKTGFFISKINNQFKVKDFENSKSALSEEELDKHLNLEKNCNYRADAISKNGSRVFTFYFKIYKNIKTLVSVSYEYNIDYEFSDASQPFIPFSESDIRKYIKSNLMFCDPTNNNATLDFDKKEIQYVDFENKPFTFESYTISKPEKISKKVSISIIKFKNVDQSDEYNREFTMTLSNKGMFYIPQIGVRASYQYSKCKQESQNKNTRKFDFEKFTISKGQIGSIKIGMIINEIEKELSGLTRKEADAFDFGFDGGGKAFIYSMGKEPILALIPKQDSDEVFAIIALNENLKTYNGLSPKSKISHLQKTYPKIEINQDLMMSWEFMYDKKNNWTFVFMTDGHNRIGKYKNPDKPTQPKKAETKMDWITIL